MFVHATSVALKTRGGRWHGLLLRGPSGAGKSDLALRVIAAGARLVSDDQTHIAPGGKARGGLIAEPPASLAGLIEVRGLGIVRLPKRQLAARAPLVLLVDLVAPERVERMPERTRETLMGVDLPTLALAPFEASAVPKLILAMEQTAAA
jgi:serine kinase of HPr protein (carbohydrate metabolism regulator)